MSDRKLHDARPSIAHDRTTDENFDAFLFVPGTYATPGKPERLRVLAGTKTMTCFEISDERTTSEARTAEVLTSGENADLHLTTEQAEWLHKTLGHALAWRRRFEAASTTDAPAALDAARPATEVEREVLVAAIVFVEDGVGGYGGNVWRSTWDGRALVEAVRAYKHRLALDVSSLEVEDIRKALDARRADDRCRCEVLDATTEGGGTDPRSCPEHAFEAGQQAARAYIGAMLGIEQNPPTFEELRVAIDRARTVERDAVAEACAWLSRDPDDAGKRLEADAALDRIPHLVDAICNRFGVKTTDDAAGTMHVDDFINRFGSDAYAAWVLHHFRLPAILKAKFHPLVGAHKLFATYEGKRYRVIGASRMGDVWLTKDFTRENGYDKRVDVAACSAWSASP